MLCLLESLLKRKKKGLRVTHFLAKTELLFDVFVSLFDVFANLAHQMEHFPKSLYLCHICAISPTWGGRYGKKYHTIIFYQENHSHKAFLMCLYILANLGRAQWTFNKSVDTLKT